MRIKKKYILEAVDKLDINKVDKAKAVIDAASELEKTAEPVFGKEKSKAIVSGLLAPDKKIDEVSGVDIHTAKFKSCVANLKAKGEVDNPYAVCQDSLGEKAIKKSHQRKEKYEESDKKEMTNEYKDIEVGADEYEEEEKARQELGMKPVNKPLKKGDLPFDKPRKVKQVVKVKDIKK